MFSRGLPSSLPSFCFLAKRLRFQCASSPSRPSVGHDVLVHTNQYRWARHLGHSLFGACSPTQNRLPTHFRQDRFIRDRIGSSPRVIPYHGNLVRTAGRADAASYRTVHRHLGLLDPPRYSKDSEKPSGTSQRAARGSTCAFCEVHGTSLFRWLASHIHLLW